MDKPDFFASCFCAFATGWCLNDGMYIGAFMCGCVLALIAWASFGSSPFDEGGEGFDC